MFIRLAINWAGEFEEQGGLWSLRCGEGDAGEPKWRNIYLNNIYEFLT